MIHCCLQIVIDGLFHQSSSLVIFQPLLSNLVACIDRLNCPRERGRHHFSAWQGCPKNSASSLRMKYVTCITSNIQKMSLQDGLEKSASEIQIIGLSRGFMRKTSLHSGRFASLDCNCTTSPYTDNPAVRSVKSIFHHTKEAIVFVDRQCPRVQI